MEVHSRARGRNSAQEKRQPEAVRANEEELEVREKCGEMIRMLKAHPLIGPFMGLSAFPNYAQAAPDPLDLSVVEKRLNSGNYTTLDQFVEDVRKIWANVQSFIRPNIDIHAANMSLSAYFEDLLAKMTASSEQPTKSSRSAKATKGSKRKSALERPLSGKEKMKLKQNVMLLPQDRLQGVIMILQSAVDMSKSVETLEFDIDKLPVRVARELDQYVKDNIQSSRKGKKTAKKDFPEVTTSHKVVGLAAV